MPHSTRRRRWLQLSLSWLTLGLPSARAQDSTTLRLGAPSSLADVLSEIARAFEATRPGVKVVLTVAASGALVDQLAQGAKLDLMASADAETVTRGVERRLLVADTVRAFASHGLVLITPASSLLSVRRLDDLAGADVQRIAMGRTATVPAGRFARQAVDALRLWPALQRKIVQAESARETLALVVQGDVDAGIVFRSDALAAGDRVRVVQTLGGHGPIRCTAALTTNSAQAALAAELVQFLRTEAARVLLRKHGLDPL